MATTLDGTVKDPAVQRNLDILARQVPIGPQNIQDGAVDTIALAANAATKLYTTTATSSGPTTTSTAAAGSFVDVVPQMTLTQDFGGNPVVVVFTTTAQNGTGGQSTFFELYDAGTAVANSFRSIRAETGGGAYFTGIFCAYTPAAGSRTLDIRWAVSAGTGTCTTTRRQLFIVELRR